jgi:lipoyl(octanoyl) transferase
LLPETALYCRSHYNQPKVKTTAQSPLAVEQRGRESYRATWARQLELHRLRKAGGIPDTLILVEHKHVITLGRQGDRANLIAPEAELAADGIELVRVERGGDITYHGPGQLVGYPIVSLRERGLSVHAFVGLIESALIELAATYGIAARRAPGLTGVWVDTARGPEKLAAIGIAVQGGVSYHGFALNVGTDLTQFRRIVPCGITGLGICSLETLIGAHVQLDLVSESLKRVFHVALHGR